MLVNISQKEAALKHYSHKVTISRQSSHLTGDNFELRPRANKHKRQALVPSSADVGQTLSRVSAEQGVMQDM